jgi:hypothetical protein
VAGNNDLEWIRRSDDESIRDYPHLLYGEAREHGVLLLDKSPVLYNGYTFAGNFGAYDLSLWQPGTPSPAFPSTEAAIKADAEECHRQAGLGLGPLELFQMCQTRLRRHLAEVENLRQPTVIATHTVPDKRFLLYGHTPAYDYQNAAMGWEDAKQLVRLADTPGLVLQLCGHTHRSQRIERPGKAPLVNISGNEQPFLFDL